MENRFLLLIVEADEATRELLTEALTREYGVYSASDALEASDLLQREPFALLLVDLELPIVSGKELIQIIRSYPEYDRLPILALSTDSHSFARLDHQIQAVLYKPFGLSELGNLVAATIQASMQAKTRSIDNKHRDDSLPTPPWEVHRNADGG